MNWREEDWEMNPPEEHDRGKVSRCTAHITRTKTASRAERMGFRLAASLACHQYNCSCKSWTRCRTWDKRSRRKRRTISVHCKL